MELQISNEKRPEGDLVGLSDMPPSLSGLNWGALLASGLWAFFHGIWSWVGIFIGLVLANIIVATLIAEFLQDAAVAQLIWVVVYTLAHWALRYVFATRADRLYWDAERRRFERQSDSSVPRYPLTVDDYLSRRRGWVTVGVIIFAYGFVSLFLQLNSGRSWLRSGMVAAAVMDAVIVISIFVWDLVRKSRAS